MGTKHQQQTLGKTAEDFLVKSLDQHWIRRGVSTVRKYDTTEQFATLTKNAAQGHRTGALAKLIPSDERIFGTERKGFRTDG